MICHAFDHVLDRDVAVKLIPLDGRPADELLEEARRLAQFSHRRVVRVHDAGTDEGFVYIVMELVEGVSADVFALSPSFRARDATRIVRQASEGLEALHDAGLVHGDVSVKNIIVGRDGEVVLVDLGLSSPGALMGGTPGFVAPEVVRTRTVSPRSDQYALGRVLVALLEHAPGHAQAAARTAARASAELPQRRFPSLVSLRRSLRLAPVRRALLGGALVFAAVALPWDNESSAALMRHIEREAFTVAEDRGPPAAHELIAAADALATRTGSDPLRLRANLLAARFSSDGAHRQALLSEAFVLAKALGDDERQAEALGLASLAATGDEDQRMLANLSAAVDPEAPIPTLTRAMAGAPSVESTNDRVTRTLAVIRASETIEQPDAAIVALDCDAFEGRWERGACLSVDAAALADKRPAVALEKANEALSLLEDGGDLEDLCLVWWARGVSQLSTDPSAARVDLEKLSECCVDCTPEDEAPNYAALAYALALEERLEEAEALLPKIEPWAKELLPTPHTFFERVQSAVAERSGR